MFVWTVKRLFSSIFTVIGSITLIFIILRVIPGDPVSIYLADNATPEIIEEMTRHLGLDQPLYIQYKDYIFNILRGDFGVSIMTRRPVIDEILYNLPYTMHLLIGSFIISLVIGIPAGMIVAFYKNSAFDHIVRPLSLVALSMPNFWLGLVLLLIFSVRLRWFPVLGAGDINSLSSILYHLVLPSITVGAAMAAMTMRISRSCLLEVMNKHYVTMAYAKGLLKRFVLINYLLRNAMIPVVTVVGLQIGRLISTTVIVETVFSRQGLGKMLVHSILQRDYPLVQGVILVSVLFVVVVNIIVDLIYFWVDPRIRVE